MAPLALRRRRRFLLRVFAYGVALLIACTTSVFVLGALLVARPSEEGHRHFVRWLGERACLEAAGAPEERERFPVPVSAYRVDGSLVLSSTEPPFAPLDEAELRDLRVNGITTDESSVQAAWCKDSPGYDYVVLGRPPAFFPYGTLALLLLAVLVVVVLGSIPFARSLSRPLERIMAVTQAFGRGELGARAEVTQDDLGDLARAFNEMAERIQGLLRSEKELLANVSHELRTPLTRLRIAIETAQERPVKAEAMLKEIAQDLDELERLVEDVMTSARLQAMSLPTAGASLPLRTEPLAVDTLLFEVVERFRRVHPEREVVLQLPQGSQLASLDPRLMRRAVSNLLDNARKYSGDTAPIALRLVRAADTLIIEVIDRGEGIEAADLAQVWTPFFRADKSRTRATGGVGLGLALVRQILRLHGGDATVESEPGQRTVFRLSLPALAADPDQTG